MLKIKKVNFFKCKLWTYVYRIFFSFVGRIFEGNQFETISNYIGLRSVKLPDMALFGGILEHFAEEEELLCYCLCREVEMPATKWGKVYSKWMEVVWKCENLHMFYVFVLCCNSLYPLDIIYVMVLHFYAILIEIHSKICNAFEKGIVLWAGRGLMITFLYKSTTNISEYKIYKVS